LPSRCLLWCAAGCAACLACHAPGEQIHCRRRVLGCVSWGQSYEKGQMLDSEARPFIWTTRLNAAFLHDPRLCSAWPSLRWFPRMLGLSSVAPRRGLGLSVQSVVWSIAVLEYGVCARRHETAHRVHRCYIVVDKLYSKSLAFQPARALLQETLRCAL
jgi:hypothetical protein